MEGNGNKNTVPKWDSWRKEQECYLRFFDADAKLLCRMWIILWAVKQLSIVCNDSGGIWEVWDGSVKAGTKCFCRLSSA